MMKQGYDRGQVIFIRKIPGVFDNIDGVASMEQDYNGATVNAFYITARLLTNAWHLYKIDV
jgi:hypothetical protein